MHGLHTIQFLKFCNRFRSCASLIGADCFSPFVRSIQPRSTAAILFSKTKRPGFPPGRCTLPYGLSHLCLRAQVVVRTVVSFRSTLLQGGDDGTRTRGIRLAKAALSQLSYIPVLCGLTLVAECRWAFQGSNLRPRPYQRRALTS
jgi:hypothetical protein